MKKFDKINRENKSKINSFKPDEEVYVEEKVDGANFRVWRDENGELRFGSRQVEFLPESDENVSYGNFTNAVEFIKSLDTSKFVEGYIYFFEAMHKHTINYDWERTPKALLFDIYHIESDTYESRTNFEFVVPKEIIVPRIFEGKYKDFDHQFPKSKYYDGLAEGYVIKPNKTSRDIHGVIHRAKVVREEFKEENRATFGSANTTDEKFVNTYCTHARIEKNIQKLEDLGHPFKLEMIGSLTFNIMKDICDEEFKKLLKINTPNFKIIRKEIQIRVKSYLTFKGLL